MVTEDNSEVDHAFQLDKKRASTFLRNRGNKRWTAADLIEECKEGCTGEEHRENCGYPGCGVGPASHRFNMARIFQALLEKKVNQLI